MILPHYRKLPSMPVSLVKRMRHKITVYAPSDALSVSETALDALRHSRKIRPTDVSVRRTGTYARQITFTSDHPLSDCHSVLLRIFGRYHPSSLDRF